MSRRRNHHKSWNKLNIVHYNNAFIQAQIKGNIKAPHHRPLLREFTGDRWITHTKGQWRGNVAIWWRHHVPHVPLAICFCVWCVVCNTPLRLTLLLPHSYALYTYTITHAKTNTHIHMYSYRPTLMKFDICIFGIIMFITMGYFMGIREFINYNNINKKCIRFERNVLESRIMQS